MDTLATITAFALTPEQFKLIIPTIKLADRERYLTPLNAAMFEYKIDTPERASAFLAQIMHESDNFRYWKELWGPTKAQKGYEGRADLGNTQPGDGKRYCGRGPIQITGRANYTKYGMLLGLDLLSMPELLEQPTAGFRSAACFWNVEGLNPIADVDSENNFKRITRRINGGLNGYDDRLRRWNAVKEILYAQA